MTKVRKPLSLIQDRTGSSSRDQGLVHKGGTVKAPLKPNQEELLDGSNKPSKKSKANRYTRQKTKHVLGKSVLQVKEDVNSNQTSDSEKKNVPTIQEIADTQHQDLIQRFLSTLQLNDNETESVTDPSKPPRITSPMRPTLLSSTDLWIEDTLSYLSLGDIFHLQHTCLNIREALEDASLFKFAISHSEIEWLSRSTKSEWYALPLLETSDLTYVSLCTHPASGGGGGGTAAGGGAASGGGNAASSRSGRDLNKFGSACSALVWFDASNTCAIVIYFNDEEIVLIKRHTLSSVDTISTPSLSVAQMIFSAMYRGLSIPHETINIRQATTHILSPTPTHASLASHSITNNSLQPNHKDFTFVVFQRMFVEANHLLTSQNAKAVVTNDSNLPCRSSTCSDPSYPLKVMNHTTFLHMQYVLEKQDMYSQEAQKLIQLGGILSNKVHSYLRSIPQCATELFAAETALVMEEFQEEVCVSRSYVGDARLSYTSLIDVFADHLKQLNHHHAAPDHKGPFSTHRPSPHDSITTRLSSADLLRQQMTHQVNKERERFGVSCMDSIISNVTNVSQTSESYSESLHLIHNLLEQSDYFEVAHINVGLLYQRTKRDLSNMCTQWKAQHQSIQTENHPTSSSLTSASRGDMNDISPTLTSTSIVPGTTNATRRKETPIEEENEKENEEKEERERNEKFEIRVAFEKHFEDWLNNKCFEEVQKLQSLGYTICSLVHLVIKASVVFDFLLSIHEFEDANNKEEETEEEKNSSNQAEEKEPDQDWQRLVQRCSSVIQTHLCNANIDCMDTLVNEETVGGWWVYCLSCLASQGVISKADMQSFLSILYLTD